MLKTVSCSYQRKHFYTNGNMFVIEKMKDGVFHYEGLTKGLFLKKDSNRQIYSLLKCLLIEKYALNHLICVHETVLICYTARLTLL